MINSVKKHEILSALYQQRILSKNLITTYFFLSQGLSESYSRKVLRELLSNSLIQKKSGIKEICYEITTKGVNCLRENGIIPLGSFSPIFNEKLLTPYQIRIDNQVVNHQLSLNNFVLRFVNEFRGISFQYYDEKFCYFFKHIRPDGMIQVNDTLYFLEMDMGTERKQRLIKKWQGYRDMLNSTFYNGLEENIKVLFILNKPSKTRKKSLTNWISEYLIDKTSEKFDLIIGDSDYLMDFLYSELIDIDFFPCELNYFSRLKHFTSPYTEPFSFNSYLTVLEEGVIKNENSTLLEFLYDDYSYNSIYIHYKIQMFNRLNAKVNTQLNRSLNYLILVPDEQTALELLLATDGFSTNIYFTTEKRLSQGIYEGFFQIYRDGTVFHFANHNFRSPIIEKKYGNMEIKTI